MTPLKDIRCRLALTLGSLRHNSHRGLVTFTRKIGHSPFSLSEQSKNLSALFLKEVRTFSLSTHPIQLHPIGSTTREYFVHHRTLASSNLMREGQVIAFISLNLKISPLEDINPKTLRHGTAMLIFRVSLWRDCDLFLL